MYILETGISIRLSLNNQASGLRNFAKRWVCLAEKVYWRFNQIQEAVQLQKSREELERIYIDGAEDLGAIFWASLFESINEMIKDGRVAVESFASRVNQSLTDTKVETIVVDDQFKGTEEIPRDVYDGIVKNAQKDKTLAVFIGNPILLPRKMFTFLKKKGILSNIRLIIDEYEKRARIIVGESSSQAVLNLA